ncbi:MAG: hypothetical protein E7653_02065 [Ruminococcaceae bacterium]|nr:hypothetical protein [Oscillospiraceae bacterium]
MIHILFSPFCLLFFIIILGFAVGRIRVYKISLGIAGVLFAAIAVGALMAHIPTLPEYLLNDAQNSMKIFSRLGSSLFVSVIGIQTGISLKRNSKGSLRAFIIGALMSAAGVVAMKLISVLDRTVNRSSLLGALCGALTSTPALSSACELNANDSASIIWGYGSSYLFGVCLTVSFAQIISSKSPPKKEKTALTSTAENKSYYELILLCVVALIGNIIGALKITLLNISIGSTASILIVGLLIGLLIRHQISLSKEHLNNFRNLGLALFFAGTGYSTGTQAMSLDVRLIIYGIIITISAILTGVLLCKLFFARKREGSPFIIAGGMTSSPAYGVLSENETEASTTAFSFAYFGALISLIIAIQVIAR